MLESFVVNKVQVSLHPRGVRAKERCSTEQSALVTVLKCSSVQSRSVSPSLADSSLLGPEFADIRRHPWLKPQRRSDAPAKGSRFVHIPFINILFV